MMLIKYDVTYVTLVFEFKVEKYSWVNLKTNLESREFTAR